eukprot:4508927-Pyramimonas_sp.AAC.1
MWTLRGRPWPGRRRRACSSRQGGQRQLTSCRPRSTRTGTPTRSPTVGGGSASHECMACGRAGSFPGRLRDRPPQAAGGAGGGDRERRL